MDIDTGCHACSTSDGSILHVLRDCTVARNFWLRSGLPGTFSEFFDPDSKSWLHIKIVTLAFFTPVAHSIGNCFFFMVFGIFGLRETIGFSSITNLIPLLIPRSIT